MDILQFINSNAIRNHLKKINYQFDTLEAAWLIYHSYNHSVYEKFNAYEQLMKEYPDCRVEERLHTPAQDSLFEYLKNYIKVYRNAIYEFEAPDAVYSIDVKHFERETDYTVKTMFTNLNAVIRQCKIEWDDEKPGDIKNFVISKYIPESEKSSGSIIPQQMILKGDGLKPIYIDFRNDIEYDLLGDLWFDFPTPFKKGDIVWNKHYKFTPVVLLFSSYEDLSKEGYKCLREIGDETDMTYEYYCMIDSDSIFRDIDYNYMDLEYYPYELTGKDKALLPISRFLKGDIDIGLCCNAFHSLSLRDYTEKSMSKEYIDKLMEESRTKKNNTYKKYIDEFMPSDEMRNYLKTQELTPYQIASLIFNSPYSIDQKKNAFYSLLNETDDNELKALGSNCIENIERSYELLNTGGVFKVTSSFVNGIVELNDEGLFSNYKDVKEFIASDIKECEYKDYDYYSYFVEKWIKNSDGILENVITYYVIKNEICYFKYSPLGDYLKEFLQGFEPKIRNFELNVPTPFKVGDVVEFDGYPFAKITFSLILSTGDNQDCCSLWNLYWADPRTWKTGAVKHGDVGYILRGNEFFVSPLYNAKRYDGVLPSTFKIFHEIKQAFGDDEQKYYELDSFVSARGITEDEIQNFINSEVVKKTNINNNKNDIIKK